MIALFVVIFVEQWISSKNHVPALIGLICGSLSLLLLGPDRFLLPALLFTVAFLMIWKPIAERKEASAS